MMKFKKMENSRTFHVVPFDLGNDIYPPMQTLADLRKVLSTYSLEEIKEGQRGNTPNEKVTFDEVVLNFQEMNKAELEKHISTKRITFSWVPFKLLREEDFEDDNNPVFVQDIKKLLDELPED